MSSCLPPSSADIAVVRVTEVEVGSLYETRETRHFAEFGKSSKSLIDKRLPRDRLHPLCHPVILTLPASFQRFG